MNDLASKECVPCRGGVPPLKGAELEVLLREVNNGWQVIDEHHLEKEHRFKNFREAFDFAVHVGELAETQRHHPDIFLTWGKVRQRVAETSRAPQIRTFAAFRTFSCALTVCPSCSSSCRLLGC